MPDERAQTEIDDSEIQRRGDAIGIVTLWAIEHDLDLSIEQKYDLADRILGVMNVPSEEGQNANDATLIQEENNHICQKAKD